ncbi:hypothetical protein QNA23_10790 [Rhodococcus erythropolis]|uniref:hypothetical protein n=1 Tax=Rhodococcus erythropolis TaxID=1833 RepID=UPI0024BAC821|nr:hypothetical protein [Rhodococcus erythropolis]MDJ0403969.1 hypothetical protein [Rhodococcus erythropolis]
MSVTSGLSDDLILKPGPRHTPQQVRAAARTVAVHATDNADATRLLAMLGLDVALHEQEQTP